MISQAGKCTMHFVDKTGTQLKLQLYKYMSGYFLGFSKHGTKADEDKKIGFSLIFKIKSFCVLRKTMFNFLSFAFVRTPTFGTFG